MNNTQPISWKNGVFLKPQHFQQQDRYHEFLLQQRNELQQRFFWGVADLTLDTQQLAVGKIGITKASGVLPDGTYFSIPAREQVPEPLDLKEHENIKTLYLALPAKNRYQEGCINIPDINTQTIQDEIEIASLNLVLRTDKTLLDSDSALAIAIIKDKQGSNRIELAEDFIPACLNISANNVLKTFIKEIGELLNYRSCMLAERLRDPHSGGSAEVVDFMLLQTMNRYDALLKHLYHADCLHPEALFSLLLQIAGELSCFTADNRRLTTEHKYQHDNLSESFMPLIDSMRSALTMVLEQNATNITLQEKGRGTWLGMIPDKHLLEDCRFVLAAYSDLPHEQLRTQLGKTVKIAPIEQLTDLVRRNLPGIPLMPISTVPRQIPYHSNFAYFYLEKRHQLWPLLMKSAGIGLQVGALWPGLKLELWAIRG